MSKRPKAIPKLANEAAERDGTPGRGPKNSHVGGSIPSLANTHFG